MDLYQRVDRIARGEAELAGADLDALREGLAEHPREWLLRVELQRVASTDPEFLTLRRQAAADLESLALDAGLAPLLSLALDTLPEVA